jgi:glycosyltransferase involved in cell wall biosynthesis
MQLYAREVVETWSADYPDDELLVVGYEWIRCLSGTNVDVVVVPETFVARASGQWLRAGVIARRWRADALLSVSHVVSPIFPRGRRVCVVHDWRHVSRPEEFGRLQRWYRKGWRWSVRHAALAVQISDKTAAETRELVPRSSTIVIENGRDHARRWPAPSAVSSYDVVTFGHFVNKRANLVVAAMELVSRDRPDLSLVVLGARGEQQRLLASQAAAANLSDVVRLPGFVEPQEYERLIANAAVVVLASSDEGFGLPVVEAEYFGVPCVVTSDSGLAQIHGDRVQVAEPNPEALARGILIALKTAGAPQRSPEGSWSATVAALRSAITGLVDVAP